MVQGWTFTAGGVVLLYCSALLLGMSLTLATVGFFSLAASTMSSVTPVLGAVTALLTTFGTLRRARMAKHASPSP